MHNQIFHFHCIIAKMKNLKRVFVFCILFFMSSCCADPFEEQNQDRVGNLPGQNFDVSFEHYSGYITVNETAGRAFFYWFFEAVVDPSSKPLALWLNGGPGCSSVAFGEAEEIGPFFPQKDGKTLYLNPYSWIQAANIIFLDSPTGVGFSYSNTPSDRLDNGDKKTAADNLAFILKWLERFPQYKGRDLYLIGESYAGHFVPQLSQLILNYNAQSDEKINLKGFLIGNPLIDDYRDQVGIFDFLYTVGMISGKTQRMLKKKCAHQPYLNFSKECRDAHSLGAKDMGGVDSYSVYTPACVSSSSTAYLLAKNRWPVGLLKRQYDPCTIDHSTAYFNLPEVQEALHVRGAPVKWSTCSNDVHYAWKDSARSVVDIIKNLSSTGLRIWVYSGNTDGVIPVTSTRYSISTLKLPVVRPFRPWYQDKQVGGWIEEYDGLTFVIVRGAGHEIPLLKPKEALTLFKSYLLGTPMESSEEKFSDI